MKNKFSMAMTLAVVLAMVVTSLALADSITTDGDVLNTGPNITINNCTTSHSYGGAATINYSGGSHFDIDGGTLNVSYSAESPVTVSGSATLSLPNGWDSNTDSLTFTGITTTVPAGTANGTYKVTVTVNGPKQPSGTLTISDFFNINVNCPTNTPPTITVNDVTKEGNALGGWTLAFADIGSASDVESTPSVSCTPAIGSVLPLGANNVSCTATDSGGLTATDSGTVTVVDTTDPTIADNVDLTLEATAPSGATATFGNPSASDIVDNNVIVGCVPPSGSIFALGHNTVTCTATDDSSNNAQSDFDVFVRDTTPPTIDPNGDETVEATGPSGAVVNYTSPATHDLVDSDGTATCAPASGSLFPLGNTTVTCNDADAAGNNAAATTFVVHVVDITDPTFVCGPADSLWHATDQSVACTASDRGSGLATPTNFSLSTNVPADTETDSASTNSQEVCDVSGNCVTAGPIGPFKIDKKAPSVSATPDRAADFGGWYNHALTITFSATDGGSGLASCDPAVNYSGPDNAAASTSGSCADNVGNSAGASFNFMYDGTTPTAALFVTAGIPGANDWYVSDVTVHTSGAGSVSDVACTGDQYQTDETIGNTFNGSCTSGAGLTTNAAPLTVKLDKTAPTNVLLTPSGTLGNNGWYISDVTITTSGTDDISAPVTCTAPQSQTTDTNGATFNGTCTNDAGMTTGADALTIKRDATAPTITAAISPARPASGWWNIASGAPTVSFTCDDATSGVVACPSANIFGEGENQTYSNTVFDDAGNSASAGVSDIDVDLTAPDVTVTPARGTDYNGWYNAPVSFSFGATDVTSDVDSCDADVNYNGPDSETANVSGSCTDNAGNSDSASAVFKYDNTDPSISASVSPSVSSYGWWNVSTGAPTASFTCGDVTAGVESCEGPHLFGNGENQSFTGNVKDNAGNTNSATVNDIDVDLIAPTISAALDRSADDSGWFNASTGAPTVEFTCSDTGSSNLASCPSDYLFGEGTHLYRNGIAYDNAGNSASDGVSDVDVDTVAPSISASVSPARPAGGWWNITSGAPTVDFTCGDGTSGVVACPSANTFGEGENQTYSDTVFDNAGNSASAGVNDIDVDLTAPSISAALDRSPAAASGWFNISTGIPSVEFICSDSGSSNLASCPTDFTFGQGADQSHNGTAYDNAGNSASAGVNNVDVDTVAPSISVALDKTPAASGWFNEVTGAPTAIFTCSDITSDIVSCPANYLFGEGADQSHEGTVFDNAGNSNTASVGSVYVDLTDPSLTWDPGMIADGASFYFGFVPAYPPNPCVSADTLSGPNGCSVTGYATTVGSHTMTATAHDVAGNEYSEQRSYTVLAWTLNGFFQPVDMGNVWNTVKNGSTIPLKFEIFAGTTELTDVSAVKSLAFKQIACTALPNAIDDAIETLAATGSTVLRYDSTGGQFIFNWKTPAPAGKCYQVTMTAQDGSFINAFFKMK